MVALTSPNSTVGASCDRKRASDVPPVVDSSGVMPVTAVMAPATSPDNAPGSVRNASPDIRAVTTAVGALSRGDVVVIESSHPMLNNLATQVGNPAGDALATLQSNLLDTTLLGCQKSHSVRKCTFQAADGSRRYVLWRNSGSSKVRAPAAGQLVQMTGETSTVITGQRLTIGTTPQVIR